MCKECGCGLDGEVTIGLHPAPPGQEEHPSGTHFHPAEDPAHTGHRHESRTLNVGRSLLEKNERLAEQNRGFFRAKQLLVLNLLSSPGSGKTTLICETVARLAGRLRVGVIAGDLATDRDAARLRQVGIPVVQITTGTVCHLDAAMVAKAAEQLDLDSLDVLVVENVGNLVCPADFDLGEGSRVVLLSVTEGEDKPLKYPPLFHSANVVLVTKNDLAEAVQFDRDQAMANLKRISHHARIFELSAKTGDGMPAWLDFLCQQRAAVRNR